MSFAAPLWLLGLLPWLGAVVYLLWGRRRRRDVPFLELWRGPATVQRAKWKVSAPPVALALAVLAALAALLGASRPAVRRGAGARGDAVTVVVDRGLTMSARGRGEPRFREAGRAAANEVEHFFGPGTTLNGWVVPGGPPGAGGSAALNVSSGDATALRRAVDALGPTAVDPVAALRQVVRDRLASTDGPVVVVTDADPAVWDGEDPRVVRVAPETPIRNVGVVRLAARSSPQPQVMVRLRNDSPLTTLMLTLYPEGRDGPDEQLPVNLPPAGQERDYFFDVKKLGREVRVELPAAADADDVEADDRAGLVLESPWPAIEVARPVGPLQRLIDLYRAVHPSGPGSRRVRLVGRAEELAAGESGVALAADSAGAGETARPTRVEPHPVTDAVRDWTELDLPAAVPGAAPPAEWRPVLWAGDRPLVAVHESGGEGGAGPASRAVWVGLDAQGWADRTEYVAFWTAVFDWAGGSDGQGGDSWVSFPLEQYDPSWRPVPAPSGMRDAREPGLWPGPYERADGARRAFNAPAVPVPGGAAPPAAWRQKLAALQSTGPGWRDLSPIVLSAAIALAVLSAAAWRRGHRTAARAP